MKILLVDDHALFRAGLRLLLATIGQRVTILEASTLDEALAAKYPYQRAYLPVNRKLDGTLTDW